MHYIVRVSRTEKPEIPRKRQHNLTIDMPVDLRQKLEKKAMDEDRTVASAVRQILREYFGREHSDNHH